MIINTALALVVGVALLALIATVPMAHAQRARIVVKHRPIVSEGDVSETWDARQNVIDSKCHEQLLATNPRLPPRADADRMRLDHRPQLHQSCLASFHRG
jgi:hypothetical protein